MLCAECLVEPDGRAWGWMAFRGETEYDPEPVLAFYCPRCASVEFGDYLRDRQERRQMRREGD